MQKYIDKRRFACYRGRIAIVAVAMIILPIIFCTASLACIIKVYKVSIYAGKTQEEACAHEYDGETMYIPIDSKAYFSAEIDDVCNPDWKDYEWQFNFNGDSAWDYSELTYWLYCIPRDHPNPWAWIYDTGGWYYPKVEVGLEGVPNSKADDICQVAVVKVNSLVWQTYGDNTPISGGKIYPGKKNYEDQNGSDRRKVKVKATLNMAPDASDNIYVYFQCWDVDDPSNSPTIDPDDNDPDPNKHSIDNRGSYNFDGDDNTISVLADGSTVYAIFLVSMQPGDNYRITATTSQEANDELTHYKVETGNIPSSVYRTPILTTWRKLWIERDSMDEVATTGDEKDFTTSTITSLDASSYDPGSNITTLDVGDVYDYWDGADRLNGGKLAVGGHEYPIVDMYDTWGDETLDVQGNPYNDGVRVNDDCDLYDDDYKGNGVFEIDFPVFTSLNAVDRLMFQEAYIEPENLSSDYEDTVSFDLNFSKIDNLTPDVTGSTDFWTVMVMNAFQPQAGNDEDPDSENATAGLSLVSLTFDNPDKCAIYHETGREMGMPMSHYMAHEIGHTQNIGVPLWQHCSDVGCVMHNGATGYEFCDDHKNDLRERSTW